MRTVTKCKVVVRYFIYDPEYVSDFGESGNIVECTESEFLAYSGTISYERHTVHANGVDQICLTKMP